MEKQGVYFALVERQLVSTEEKENKSEQEEKRVNFFFNSIDQNNSFFLNEIRNHLKGKVQNLLMEKKKLKQKVILFVLILSFIYRLLIHLFYLLIYFL